MSDLLVEVWSDFACPWCALGFVRLEAARQAFEHGDRLRVVHRSFELDPHAPARRERTMEEAVARKYGLGSSQVRAGHARLTALGAEEGLTFAFDRVRLGSTFDAHRLAQAARDEWYEHALIRGLFVAQFTEGRQLSDPAVLRDVATASGVPGDVTERVLTSSVFGAQVRTDESRAVELDVTGVPHFLVGGAWPVPGAQDVETLLVILRRAWSRLESH